MAAAEREVLDVLGTYCPVPVIETRRIIQKLSEPVELILLTDDSEALHDIPALMAVSYTHLTLPTILRV